ncbi:uncharacterized protein LOC134553621 [Prinia subflava]|uniref:uncharacterized protein LOC134553621 n=1 Tax=Prinia subflava TaxID=208062 RepID=UPI002FE2FF8E
MNPRFVPKFPPPPPFPNIFPFQGRIPRWEFSVSLRFFSPVFPFFFVFLFFFPWKKETGKRVGKSVLKSWNNFEPEPSQSQKKKKNPPGHGIGTPKGKTVLAFQHGIFSQIQPKFGRNPDGIKQNPPHSQQHSRKNHVTTRLDPRSRIPGGNLEFQLIPGGNLGFSSLIPGGNFDFQPHPMKYFGFSASFQVEILIFSLIPGGNFEFQPHPMKYFGFSASFQVGFWVFPPLPNKSSPSHKSFWFFLGFILNYPLKKKIRMEHFEGWTQRFVWIFNSKSFNLTFLIILTIWSWLKFQFPREFCWDPKSFDVVFIPLNLSAPLSFPDFFQESSEHWE